MIYLDNAATTQPLPEIVEKIMPYMKEAYGNPGSVHHMGSEAKRAIDEARRNVAAYMGAKSEKEIIFTSGGSEANSLAVSRHLPCDSMTVCSATEHESVLRAVRATPAHKVIPVGRDGKIYLDELERVEKRHPIEFLSVMHTNNETGAVNPIEEIGEFCREHAIIFHTDCTQTIYDKINVQEFKCDMATISSHKLHGLKGTGALYVSKYQQEVLSPLIYGGQYQEFGFRGGTENVAGIVAMGEACRLATLHFDERREKIKELTSEFLKTLYYEAVRVGVSHLYRVTVRGNNIINLCFGGIDGESLLAYLDMKGVCVSAGSACTAQEQKPSHVLLAMGLSADDARNSVRVSFSHLNTKEESAEAAKIIVSCVKNLKTAANYQEKST